jgi:hypothetical protein
MLFSHQRLMKFLTGVSITVVALEFRWRTNFYYFLATTQRT